MEREQIEQIRSTGLEPTQLEPAMKWHLLLRPPELLIKVQPIFYSDPIDAVFKALGAV
ncbi:hypothetical protein [Syntrophomonas wolfei]|uniref:hypothetical protein n=1 Tax=Syntrophomonas wolfei TaxID=863 RepID=UPI0002EC20E5|nr:hypothetical protein [Syntrophomonas wolfei]